MSLAYPFKITESNHKRVLNTIRINEQISGADLSRNTGLQPSSITYILRSLKNKGLIQISGTGKSTHAGGKRPTLWQMNANAGYIIGLEFIYHELRISMIDFQGSIIYQKIVYQSDRKNNNSIDTIVTNTILDSINEANIESQKMIGVGLAVTGLINIDHNFINYSRVLDIQNIPLKSLIQKKLDIPVFLANDANAGALGIQWHLPNSVKDPHHIIYLTINEDIKDIGAGLILNGNLYQGAKGFAGEIFSSLNSIVELTKQAKTKFAHSKEALFPLNLKEAIQNAQQGQNISKWILTQWANAITTTINTIIGLLNPDQIILGGDIAQSDWLVNQMIKPEIKRIMTEQFPEAIVPPRIEISQFGVHSVSMGATALVLREIMGE